MREPRRPSTAERYWGDRGRTGQGVGGLRGAGRGTGRQDDDGAGLAEGIADELVEKKQSVADERGGAEGKKPDETKQGGGGAECKAKATS